ncbi:MFS transporter, DHA1 family, multidrug resistance protein B [Amycolatopsis pretoriensis]|uniref:MFS transporter, DHA1 family, multidrug resistance protein B n=1 Tax=Amycolatopsis pretoriensis TaxID=218821 RepID=A0A1H5RKG6_9PSEU|nr:MFS transporter [Amycolatopsis pretoriensis]SEF38001.1 MFS transporter, DHA1 family, multidrug resistance protein B [Amycolatopsis pretoriensis]
MRSFFALHRNVRVRIGLAFVHKLIDAMILTFIAIYLAAHVGVAVAGALILVFAAFALVGMLVGGHLSERWGRRPVLVIGDLIGTGFLVVMAVAYYSEWGALAVYFSYAVVKFGTNLALPANDATIIDVTPPEDRKFVYTVNYWVINVALGTGALLGAFLYSTHFGAVILGGAIGMAFALTITVTMVAETKPEVPRPPTKLTGLAQFAQGYKVVLADSTFRRLIIAATLILTLEGQLSTAIGIRLSTDFPTQPVFPFGAVTGVEMLGVLKAVNTVLVVAFALVVNTLLKRMPDRARLYAGITLYAGGFAVLAVTDDAWLLLVAVVVLTVGELMNLPVQQALLAELAPDDGRPRYLAAYYLHIRFGQIVNSILISLSAVVSMAGMAGIYLAFGVVIILQYRAILARRETRVAVSA